jgi:outer membrane biosynthesis protein TonB
LGKYWRQVGLHAVRFSLRALTLGTLLCGAAQSASAAPVTAFQVELTRHGGDFEAACRAVEKQFAEMGQIEALAEPPPKPEPEPETQPEPQPTKIVAPAVAQLPAPTGGTMSSTSVTSTGGSSPSIPPATLADTPDLLLATSGERLAASDWLFIPPRFLDGIFRPPRHVVSL